MSAASLINARLMGDTGVNAIASIRVHLYQAPLDSPMPCITYFQVSDNPVNHLRGKSTLNNQRWQIDCWADRHSAADTLSEAVITAMTKSGADLQAILLSALADREGKEGLHRVTLDFSIWF